MQMTFAAQPCSTYQQLGNRLRQEGRTADALAQYRLAVDLHPTDAIAQANLAQMLLSLDRTEAALVHAQTAVQLQPANALLHLIRADVFRMRESFEQARESYLEAARLQPTLARAHAHLGLLYRAQRQVQHAFAPIRRALALEPNNAAFWKHLAEAAYDWEDFPEAIRCWERALALQPGESAFHVGYGNALTAADRLVDAERALRTAAQLKPDSPEPLLALGYLFQEQGDSVQAETAYRAALALDSKLTRAQWALARLLGKRLPDADVYALQERFTDPSLPHACCLKLHDALAGVLDQRGDHAAAALHARQANELGLAQVERRGGYDPARHRAFVDQLKATFTKEFFTRVANSGSPSERPVFVFGLPRSGTTLVEQILASHPRVHGAGELRLVGESFLAIPQFLGRNEDALTCVPSLDGKTIAALADQHLAWLRTRHSGATRVVDKLPDNYLYLGLLAAMFPRATFIHCRRDLRDVAVSCWFTHFHFLQWTHDAGHIRSRFEAYESLMAHWREVLPVTLHEVRYEELVRDVESGARQLIAACKLDWDPACLHFHRTRRPVRTASAAQVRQPIYTHSVGRWRHYEEALRDLFAGMPSS
jgi:tetratricopeptide (TPR) repeat protein